MEDVVDHTKQSNALGGLMGMRMGMDYQQHT
jgi:hypothetical protein